MNKAMVVIVFEAHSTLCYAFEKLTHSFCKSVLTTSKLQISLEGKKIVSQAQKWSQGRER